MDREGAELQTKWARQVADLLRLEPVAPFRDRRTGGHTVWPKTCMLLRFKEHAQRRVPVWFGARRRACVLPRGYAARRTDWPDSVRLAE